MSRSRALFLMNNLAFITTKYLLRYLKLLCIMRLRKNAEGDAHVAKPSSSIIHCKLGERKQPTCTNSYVDILPSDGISIYGSVFLDGEVIIHSFV